MRSDSTNRHRTAAAARGPVPVAIVTVSDTRLRETDAGGDLIESRTTAAGHRVVYRAIVKDEPAEILRLLDEIVDATEARVILFTGGTGIAARDTTYDAISGRLEKTLPGFGELFRALSFNEIGPAAMLSRATAGTYRGCFVFSMPGSPHAVQLALDKLIIPELSHLAWEVAR